MIGRNFSLKLLSVIAVLLVSSFGSAHAADSCVAILKSVGDTQASGYAYIDSRNEQVGDVNLYGLKTANTFGVTYGNAGSVIGAARCSAISTNATYGTVAQLEKEDVTGSSSAKYCYCGLTEYMSKAQDKSDITMPWVAYNNKSLVDYKSGSECAASCAIECARALVNVERPEYIEYRNVVFNAITKCEYSDGGNPPAQHECGSNSTWNGTICACNSGYVLNGGVCSLESTLTRKCTESGGTWSNHACSCPTNAMLKENRCVCKTNYVLVGGSSLADNGAHCAVSGGLEDVCVNDFGGTWSNNTCTCPVEHSEYDGAKCVCVTGYHLSDGAFNLGSDGAYCEADSGTGSNLERVCTGSGGRWGNGVCVCETGYHVDNGGRCVADSISESGRICIASGGTWASNTCTCPSHASVDTGTGRCVCNSGYHVEGDTELSQSGRCEPDSVIGGLRGTAIKLATTAYNNARFSSVQTDLNNAVTKIKSVVAQALANAANVATISSTKQTRPDDLHACAAGKTCLLVTAPNGVNNWYEIIDCGEVTSLMNLGAWEQGGENINGSPGKACDGRYPGMGPSTANACQLNEWTNVYHNAALYGVARAVAIAERTQGDIVQLPNNVQTGEVCVCRATAYVPIETWSAVSSEIVFGTRTAINTDKWVVAGMVQPIAYGQMPTDYDEYCIGACGFNTDKNNYFTNIANSCNGAASTANMCVYNRWFRSILNDDPSTGNIGYYSDNVASGLCDAGSGSNMLWNACGDMTGRCNSAETSWIAASGCQSNTWVTSYPSVTATADEIAAGDANVPDLIGYAYCVDMETPAAGTVLGESEIGTKVHDVTANGAPEYACLCKLTHYMNRADNSWNATQSTKYISTGQRPGKCYSTCSRYCAEYFRDNVDNAVIRELADSCAVN